MARSKPAPAPDALRREHAGTYRSVDGRFTVEQASSGWMVLDAEQADGLGLPLARGPYATLDAAKAAMAEARSGPAPSAAAPIRAPAARAPKVAGGASPAPRVPAALPPRPIVIRELRGTDGDELRRLWHACGLQSLGDDDRSLLRMARRNPGLCLVAAEGTRVVASALAGWDGRRGWIYHVATAPSHRRQGIASRMLDQIEAALAVLGAPKVNAMVQAGNDEGRAFWTARGYGQGTAEQFGKEL